MSAGESHGKGVLAILEGVPKGLFICKDFIDFELLRRQQGVGRGERMNIEKDEVEFFSGVSKGYSTGAPIALIVKNKDFIEYQEKDFCTPRPGHADLSGCIKYDEKDFYNIAERSSARETVSRVIAGSVAKLFLKSLNINIMSHIVSIYGEKNEKKIEKLIEKTKKDGDTLGGVIEIVAKNMIAGIGSHVHYDRKLDFHVSAHLGSIQGVKSVEIGLGVGYSDKLGSLIHDEIKIENGKIIRPTNNAGGIEGGISNGEDIVVRVVQKPIPTTVSPQNTINLNTEKNCKTEYVRSDVCAVHSCGIICENALAIVLMQEILKALGGDTMNEVIARANEKRRIRDEFFGK
ncbi:MAG: chorismate synthase [Firmicutes bacterium]|nr:chorismate synthase [Bacillota bacterium]